MPRRRSRRRLRCRFFVLDGEVLCESERDAEQFLAVRLDGADRELVLRMTEENEVEMESRLLGGWE